MVFLDRSMETLIHYIEEIDIELNNKLITVASILTFLCAPKRENTHLANPLIKGWV